MQDMKQDSIIREVFIASKYKMDDVNVTEKYKKLSDIWNGLDEELTAKLAKDKELLDLFEQYKRAYENFSVEETDMFYENAIKLGIRIGLELTVL